MAVANTKSTYITNADATPPVLTNTGIANGLVHETVGFVETLAADDAASVYRLCRVPSNARLTSIKLASGAITGATASGVGVYYTAARSAGAVLDADFFATDVDISLATAFTEVMLEATATDIAKVEKKLWELFPGTFTTDPGGMFDICVTVNNVTAAGTIAMKVQYAI